MKTHIFIKGQIQSAYKLRNLCETNKRTKITNEFNHYRIYYDTKKDATEALHKAYKYLKENDGGDYKLSYCKGNLLTYDAATASIDRNYKYTNT